MDTADALRKGMKSSEVVIGMGGFGAIAIGILTGTISTDNIQAELLRDILKYAFILSGLLMTYRTAIKIVALIMGKAPATKENEHANP